MTKCEHDWMILALVPPNGFILTCKDCGENSPEVREAAAWAMTNPKEETPDSMRDMVEVPKEVWNDLKRFLLSREDDIALDMENFGDLTGSFFFIVGRRPES